MRVEVHFSYTHTLREREDLWLATLAILTSARHPQYESGSALLLHPHIVSEREDLWLATLAILTSARHPQYESGSALLLHSHIVRERGSVASHTS